jgi:hypothetical protein
MDGYWCSNCHKAAPTTDTIRLSAGHGENQCSGTYSKTLVQQINKRPQFWAVFACPERDSSVEDEMEEQLENEVQYQDEVMKIALTLDRIHILNNHNINQYVWGTEWLALIGNCHIQPICALVELPKLEERNSRNCIGVYPALCSLLEEYVASLEEVLVEQPCIIHQQLNAKKQ